MRTEGKHAAQYANAIAPYAGYRIFTLYPVPSWRRLIVLHLLLRPSPYGFDHDLHGASVQSCGFHKAVTEFNGIRVEFVQGVGMGRKKPLGVSEDVEKLGKIVRSPKGAVI
jgi:hypothetical protein